MWWHWIKDIYISFMFLYLPLDDQEHLMADPEAKVSKFPLKLREL
jgi:hypothetical protein